jgi:hypothetical protein
VTRACGRLPSCEAPHTKQRRVLVRCWVRHLSCTHGVRWMFSTGGGTTLLRALVLILVEARSESPTATVGAPNAGGRASLQRDGAASYPSRLAVASAACCASSSSVTICSCPGALTAKRCSPSAPPQEESEGFRGKLLRSRTPGARQRDRDPWGILLSAPAMQTRSASLRFAWRHRIPQSRYRGEAPSARPADRATLHV